MELAVLMRALTLTLDYYLRYRRGRLDKQEESD